MALTLEYFFDRITPEPNTGCWLWTGRQSPRGYGDMTNGRQGHYPAHRFSYEQLVAPVPSWDGLMCCHRCDTPACVNPQHLFVGTRSDNMRDAGRKGRHWSQRPSGRIRARANLRIATQKSIPSISGQAHYLAVLTFEDLRVVIALLDQGVTLSSISRRFGCSRQVIASIKHGKTYKYEVQAIRALLRGGKDG